MTRMRKPEMRLPRYSPDLSADPIDSIRCDHDKQLEICDELENIVSAVGGKEMVGRASSVLIFFQDDLPLHFEDEETGLFPMLLSRVGEHEDLKAILEQLVSEHELDCGLIEPIITHLESVIEGTASTDAARFRSNVWSFTTALRRHLSWEENVVLPLAEKILTAKDRAALKRRFHERRHMRNTDNGTACSRQPQRETDTSPSLGPTDC